MSVIDGLTGVQRDAAAHVHGPTLILAGAGSGKTRTLTHRLAHLLEEGAEPESILAITFTNKAAREMQERVEGLTGRRDVMICTFHSACAFILRREAGAAGYRKNFSIYDGDEQAAAMRQAVRELGDTRFPEDALETLALAKAELEPPPTSITILVEKYQEILRRNNAVDFEDLIRVAVEIFRTNPRVLARWQERFRHILVDEYQDTNRAQYTLIKLLASRSRLLCAVGDPDQAIYGWRGADVRNILEFQADYPEARVFVLEENFRSTPQVLTVANALIARNRMRAKKKLVPTRADGAEVIVHHAGDDSDEAEFIAGEVKKAEAAGVPWNEIAVLYRVNAMARAIEEAFLRKDIPYRIVGGTRFFHRKEIKDLLAYLKVIDNPDDALALERIINVPRRGIGKKTLAALRGIAKDGGRSLYDVLDDDQKTKPFRAMMEGFRGKAGEVRALIGEIIEKTGYAEALQKEDTPTARSRLANLEQFMETARLFERENGDGGLEGFLQNAALMSEEEEREDGVLLMSLHSSKGLEFRWVFLAGLEEGILPHFHAMESEGGWEEERRLAHVGMTRAKDRLYLTCAGRRFLNGHVRFFPPSPFLAEALGEDGPKEKKKAG